jgi:uncharacterized DUF497 family protein
VSYQWDTDKAKLNKRKHRVDFSDAVGVFEDKMATTREDPDAEGEQTFVTLGMDSLGRLLVVVFTYRAEEEIRLISARKATVKEAKEYAKRI